MKSKGRHKRGLTFIIVLLMSLIVEGHTYAEKAIIVSIGTVNTEAFGANSEFGIEMDFIKSEWPVNLVVGYRVSNEELSTYEYTDPTDGKIISESGTFRSELSFGVRKIWGSGSIRPFFGAGLSIVNVSTDYWTGSENVFCDWFFCARRTYDYGYDHTQELGTWFDAGVYLIENEHLKIGMNVRRSKVDGSLYSNRIDLGGSYFGIQIGVHF